MIDGGHAASVTGTAPDALASFEPITLGPFQVDHVPASGLLLALFFLLSLRLSLRASRGLGIRRVVILETYLASVPVALAGSRLPALAALWPRPLDDPSAWLEAVAAGGDLVAAAAACALAVAVMTWVSARPPAVFLDALAPAPALGVGALLGRELLTQPGSELIPAAVGLGLTLAGAVVAARPRADGVPAGTRMLLSLQCCCLALLLTSLASAQDGQGGWPSRPTGMALALAALLALRLALGWRRRPRGTD